MFKPLDDTTIIGHEPDPPEQQLKAAMRAAGIDPPDAIIWDGKIHRSDKWRKDRSDSAWYAAFTDRHGCQFGDFKEGIQQTWQADIGRPLSLEEQVAFREQVEAAKKAREEDEERRRKVAALSCQRIWSNAKPAPADQPYLARKKVKPHGLRVTSDGRLIIPMSSAGEISSLQYIGTEKRFAKDGAARGSMFVFGDPFKSDKIYLAEGWATGATLYEQTGVPTVVAFSANWLPIVAAKIKAKTDTPVVIVADNDPGGQGEAAATQAAADTGYQWVMPDRLTPDKGTDANDWWLSGRSLDDFLRPPDTSWLIPVDEFCDQPAPVPWLIRKWLQAGSLAMMHGPSGVGKSFLAIDWACRISHGLSMWGEHRVNNGPVVYCAGEGHYGMRARMAAWRQHNNVTGKQPMWVSKSGCDLDTAQGYLKVRDTLRALPEPPVLVIIDTLHRFLAGDENLAVDAKKMIDACGKLQHEFGCTVLLVHHTGNNAEAKHRARGSSAWKGALETEINVTQEDGVIIIKHTKAKDSEQAKDIEATFEKVLLDGWKDEDGLQVGSVVLCTDAYGLDSGMMAPPVNPMSAQQTFERIWWNSGQNHDLRITVNDVESWCEDTGAKALAVSGELNAVASKEGNAWYARDEEWAAELRSKLA